MLTANRLTWRASSHIQSGENRVEVAPGPDGVLVRDSKDCGTGPVLRFDRDEWTAFLAAAVDGAPIPTVTVADALTRHRLVPTATRWHVSSPQSPIPLHFAESEWSAFLAGARAGEFDVLVVREESALAAV